MNKISICVVFMLLLILPMYAMAASSDDQNYGNLICSDITSIYDGDTFRCNIEGVHPLLGNRIGIRVNGVDTPEMKDKRPAIKELAQKAKQYTVAKLRAGKVIELRNVTRGKYFRIVADVFIDNQNLANLLIAEGLGKKYDGGKKEW
ncbi:thermonuclease family protein [Deferribacteres bacterium DY0037]